MAMNLLRASASRSARLGRSSTFHSMGKMSTPRMPRAYSTGSAPHSTQSSNTPWFIGSLMIFGPVLFKLTSPPPKKPEEKIQHVATETVAAEPTPVAPTTPAPKIQKPYVLIGSGTASYAAAQAIKEKQPDANVCILLSKRD